MKTIIVGTVMLAALGAVAWARGAQPAAAAGSCSGWKAICDSRGPGCGAKLAKCIKTGCWTEAPRYGGQQHCGLTKK